MYTLYIYIGIIFYIKLSNYYLNNLNTCIYMNKFVYTNKHLKYKISVINMINKKKQV